MSTLKVPTQNTSSKGNSNTILSRKVLNTYFKSFDYAFVRHHIDSYDQLLTQDIPAVLKANNPFLLLKELIPGTSNYMYRVEIFIGGEKGDALEIGTPTISLQKATEVRVLFPNEARLRNLTYASTVYADVFVRVTITNPGSPEPEVLTREYKRMPIFQLPIMLHSRFCILHGKPTSFLQEAGECTQDQGGYFVIEGSEKVLITRQEQAFNTLYVTPQPRDPKIATYANITCLSPITRQVKVISFHWMRSTDSLVVTIPYVRKPIPIFVLFRAMGIQSDKDILQLLYPNLDTEEAKYMMTLLLPSIAEAVPFLDTYSAIQYIKAMTKGFSENHVYDILFNQVFIHITDIHGGGRQHFLAECVRQFMRVHVGIDPKTDRDDTRNQRCLTSGFLLRMLFNNSYSVWKKAVRLAVDKEYEFHPLLYGGSKFINIFSEGNTAKLFNLHLITEGLTRGFKGKWVTGGAGGGGSLGHSDEKTGVLQALSRISYLDFMSHCRRVSLNFDTTMKITGPRQLHTSQYGYFCTSETPGGASIGVAKNLSYMTLISTATNPDPVVRMMIERSWVIPCSEMRNDLQQAAVPVFVNNGIVGYTLQPFELKHVLKLMKWTGCLPAFASIGFSIQKRRLFLYLDEGRPCRPLVHIKDGVYPATVLGSDTTWRTLVLGTFGLTAAHGVSTTGFTDPLADTPGTIPMESYVSALEGHVGCIEYVDPYEQNEILLVSFPEEITKDTSHVEIHPSTIISIVNSMIPFANFNQSPRNQLSCAQSKQALGMYATNFKNRYDNSANISCYAEAPLVRTYLYDVLGDGIMPYGHNLIMAIMPFHGYNQDDGIVFNADAFQRGQFRNMNYRSYETFEEVDKAAQTASSVANPERVPQWTDLKPGRDYTKLDERGVIKVGEVVDENTVLVGKYIQDKSGKIKDASLTPQVWTSGRVESVVVTVNTQGRMLVKVRITQDRIPEFGDKFSTRHGQKGTIGMIYRAHDMPRTADGLVPDMIVNPHCIPSRMTVAQLMEMLFGWVCYKNSVIGDATVFTSDAKAPEAIGAVLEGQFGMEKTGNVVLYDGASGVQMETTVFIGPVYGMRLKHMVEDKWNSRAEGRREQKTHQPTGGRGAQGGLRIGEMERDGLAAHGIASFLKESLMERADKTAFRICNGCGTVPIFNERQKLFICSLCDGPVKYIGSTSATLEALPTVDRSMTTTSIVEMPYATKLLGEELQTYLNMGLRILTAKSVAQLRSPSTVSAVLEGDALAAALAKELPTIIFPETRIPEYRVPPPEEVEAAEEDLYAMGVLGAGPAGQEEEIEREQEEEDRPMPPMSAMPAMSAMSAMQSVVPVQPMMGMNVQPIMFQGQPQVLQPMQMQQPVQMQQQQPVQMQQQQPVQMQQQQQFGDSEELDYDEDLSPTYAAVTPPNVQEERNREFMQQQQQQGGMMFSMASQPMYLQQQPTSSMFQAPVMGGAPIFAVDTSPHVMQQGGYSMPPMQMGGSQRRRHTTPRSRGPPTVGGKIAAPNTRITVNKIG